jgi:hypothetical protein
LSSDTEQRSLRADYDDRSLRWVLQRAEQMPRNGSLQKVVVKTDKQEIAGWYIYYLNPGGFSEVVQFNARTDLAQAVLNHLLYHAWKKGATVLRGRIEPQLLVHSHRPELVHAFQQGEARFSRLDGEWCFHFR